MYKDCANWHGGRSWTEELHWGKSAWEVFPIVLANRVLCRVFQIPWQRIVSATESLAASHETFAAKIESDVERPLKEYATRNPDLSALPSMHNDLLNLSKTLDAAQKKADKAKDKKAKGADKAKLSLSEAARQWEARAPSAFEQLQAADENRLIHLRDVLTQFQTHEVDQIERAREIAESCLNVLLNVETADEIKTFAAKISGGRDETAQRPSTSATAATTTNVDIPAPTRTQDETGSQYSNQSGRAAGPSPPGRLRNHIRLPPLNRADVHSVRTQTHSEDGRAKAVRDCHEPAEEHGFQPKFFIPKL